MCIHAPLRDLADSGAVEDPPEPAWIVVEPDHVVVPTGVKHVGLPVDLADAFSFEHFAAGTLVEAGTLTATVQDGTDYDLGTPSSVDVAIVIGATVRFEMASYSVGEADFFFNVKLIARTGPGAPKPTSNTSSLSFSAVDGSATGGIDYTFGSVGQNFSPSHFSMIEGVWQAENGFGITITNDGLDEDDETFDLNLEYQVGHKNTPLVDASGNSCGTKCEATVTITDDDTVAVTVSETALTVEEQDTTGNAYTVVLESQPTADVTVTVAGHSGTAVTVTPTTPLTFTTMNWDTAQTVTVKAVNDTNTADETVSLTHSAASTDSDYNGIAIAGVTVTVEDDDRASTDLIWSATMTVEVSTFSNDAWGYGFNSTGSTENYGSLDDTTLTLNSTEYFVRHLYAWDDTGTTSDQVYFVIDGAAGPRANADGLILEWAGAVLSLDTNSASSTYDMYGTSRTWSVSDGKLPSTSPLHPDNIRTTLVPGSTVKACLRTAMQFCPDTSVTPPATTVGVTLSESALTVTEEDTTGDTYTVVLDSEPTASVTIAVAGHASTAVNPTPASLTFTTMNWDTAQTVTVKAVNDANTANETVSLTHSATSTDTDYDAITIAGVTVTVDDNDNTNTPAEGKPAISGTAQVGETLTAAIGNIADTDGLPTTFPDDYTFKWLRVDADGVSNETAIGDDAATYTPVAADVGKKVRVQVSFTDDESNREERISDAYPSSGTITDIDGNNPATGTLAISGTAQVGETLTAAIGNIADTDGLPTTFPDDYTFKWLRVDADGVSNETAIGDDAATYTPVAADVGKKVRVQVSFTDDESNREERISDAYPSSGTITAATLPALSFEDANITVDETAGTATLTVELDPASTGTVTVDFATRDGVGGAKAGEDYTATSGTQRFVRAGLLSVETALGNPINHGDRRRLPTATGCSGQARELRQGTWRLAG